MSLFVTGMQLGGAVVSSRGSRVRSLAAVFLTTISGVLPAFLVGALAVQVQSDLLMDDLMLGVALAVFFLFSSVSAAPGGRFADRVGWRTGLRVAAVGSIVSLGGVGLVDGYWLMLPFLALGGVVNALAMSTGNIALAVEIPAGRHGLIFGLKQTAVPMGTMLAGLSVPLVALTVGWRWAFAMAIALPVAALLLVPPRTEARVAGGRPHRKQSVRLTHAPLIVLAVAGCVATMAVGALNTFTVLSIVDVGLTPSTAGIIVAVASGGALVVRVGGGWLADRRRSGGLRFVAVLLGLGSVGLFMMASTVPVVVSIGAVLAYAGAWGWPGLLFFGIVLRYPGSAGLATGVVQTGLSIGSAAGPLLFAALASAGGYTAGWLFIAAMTAFAAVAIGRMTLKGGTLHLDRVGR